MSASFELPEVDRVTVGTVGEPGQRTFYLQARQGQQLATIELEKQQVAALAQHLAELLADLPATDMPSEPEDSSLEEPVLAEWAAGTMQLAYDAGSDRVILLAEEVGDPDADEEDGLNRDPADGGVSRMAMTRAQAAGLIRTAAALVTSGRPTCPLCGNPMDPAGHSCPRTNGHGPKH